MKITSAPCGTSESTGTNTDANSDLATTAASLGLSPPDQWRVFTVTPIPGKGEVQNYVHMNVMFGVQPTVGEMNSVIHIY